MPVANFVVARSERPSLRKIVIAASLLLLIGTGMARAQPEDNSRIIELHGVSPEDIRLLGTDAVALLPDVERLRLNPNQWAAKRLPGPAQRSPDTGGRPRWDLPYEIMGVAEDGTPIDLRPLVEVGGGGMRPSGIHGGYSAQIFLAVQDANRPIDPRPIEPPIRVLVTGEVDEVEPANVELAETNTFTEVTLRAMNPEDPVSVRIIPNFGLEGTEIGVPVRRGRLSIDVTPSTIQGLGLETATLVVRADAGLSQGMQVTLITDRGSLDTTSIELDAAGTASTKIRSISTGVATIRAEAAGMAPADTQLVFAVPWIFVISALLGGAVGSLIRWKRASPDQRRNLGVEVGFGALAGFLVAVAYAVGINLVALTGFQPAARAGEALVFVLAALGALFGIKNPASPAP